MFLEQKNVDCDSLPKHENVKMINPRVLKSIEVVSQELNTVFTSDKSKNTLYKDRLQELADVNNELKKV